MTWSLTIELKPPNLNDHRVNRAGGRSRDAKAAFAAQAARYRKARSEWLLMIRNQMQMSSCPDASAKRRVVYTRVMGEREREWDYDNLVGGGKMVFDAMIKAGLLVDDSATWCEREYRQERGSRSALRLDISDIGG